MRGLLLFCSWLLAFGLRAQADSTQALVISAASGEGGCRCSRPVIPLRIGRV